MITKAAGEQTGADSNKYRPDIDGLRALAVVAVIAFHLFPDQLPGGFVGVDVFFVISGFLITSVILSDLDAGKFSFANFYWHRAKRLFPALFVTLLGTFLASAWIMSPADLASEAGSSIAALLSVSNFFFWQQSGYFDAEALTKPLLHTWSLSIEEQFYAVWPACLYFLYRKASRQNAIVAVSTVSVLSLCLVIGFGVHHRSATFYLLPFRVYEFGLGILAQWGLSRFERSHLVGRVLAPVSLALLLLSTIVFSSKMRFPSYAPLLPCLSTAILLASGPRSITARLSSLRPIVLVGRWSYALYLVHWPVIVLFNVASYGEVTGTDRLKMLAITCVFSIALHYLVEKPIRYALPATLPRRYVVSLFAFCGIALIATASHADMSGGWMWRLPYDISRQLGPFDTVKNYQINNSIGREPFSGAAKTKVLIIGNSHQADFFNAMYLNREAMPDIEFRSMRLDDQCFYMFAPSPMTDPPINDEVRDRCAIEVRDFKTSDRSRQANFIVISTKWDLFGVNNLHFFNAWLKDHPSFGGLIVLGRTMEFRPVPSLLMEYGKIDSGLAIFAAKNRDKTVDAMNANLENISSNLGLSFFRKDGWICEDGYRRCDVVDENGNLAIYDYGHWSLDGAKFFGRRVVKSDLISSLRRPASGSISRQ